MTDTTPNNNPEFVTALLADQQSNKTYEYEVSHKMLVSNGTFHNGSSREREPKMSTTAVLTHITVPPDGGWGWIVVAASFCCNLVVDGIIYSFGMFLTEIANSFGESRAKVSLVGSLLSGSYLIAGPFASALANRYGFKLVTVLGAILGSIAFFASSFGTNIEFLCVTYGVIGGTGFGLIFVPSVITIGFYFEKWRALATGIAVCGSGVGTFIMAPVSAWLIQQYTWRGALMVQAAFILNCAAFGLLFRPLKPISVKVPVQETSDQINQIESKEPQVKTKVCCDSKVKSESLLNIYEDLGIAVDNCASSKTRFNNNNKYPTVSQILQLDIISDERQQPWETSESQGIGVGKEFETTNSTKTGRSLRNKSLSPELLKRNSLIPEMRILLNRKHSLQIPQYKSQSFSSSSPGTLGNKSSQMHRRHTEFGNRPLYKDDIFFSSNLKRLSQYTSQASTMDYTMSVTRLPTYTDILEEKKRKFSLLPEAMRRALGTMLDVSLLQSVTFIVLAISGFFTAMGMYTPFIYINERAISFGIDNSVWLISVLGFANTIGRVGFGVLSSIPRVNAVLINNLALTICGIFTMFSGTIESKFYQFLYASMFGLTIACFSSLRTIIIVDLLGLEKLTNAFGLLLLFQGIAAVIGPPVAGFFVDITGNYDLSFYVSGALIILSAAVCYPIQLINKWEKSKTTKK